MFNLTFESSSPLEISFDSPGEMSVEFGSYIEVPVAVYYEGPYEITPTPETQTLEISGLTASRNITVNPIPSNYGLITWNGSVLTVS